MKDWIKTKLQTLCCHRAAYAGILASYTHAAYSTGHPEVYLPFAAFYALLIWLG